jgi:hypothetical protein
LSSKMLGLRRCRILSRYNYFPDSQL